MPRDAFVLKIQRELCHPKYARNFSGLLRNRPLASPGQFKRCTHQGPVSRKSRKLSGPEKPFVKLRPANYVKPVFSYVVKGKKLN